MYADLDHVDKMWIKRVIQTALFEVAFVISLVLTSQFNYFGLVGVARCEKKYVLFVLRFFAYTVALLAGIGLLYIKIFFPFHPIFLNVCLSCLGIYFLYWFYSTTLSAVCRLVLIALRRIRPIKASEYRSRLIKVHTAILHFSVCASLFMTVYGLVTAGLPPVANHVRVELRDFPRSMNDFKIMLVTDVHVGLTVDKSRVDRITNVIASEDYDLLAAVGDFTDLPASAAKVLAEPLKDLKPKYGKYFVTGNHEYYQGDVDKWLEVLSGDLGFRVLRNENVNVSSGDDSFLLAGVDDELGTLLKGHGTDLESALQGCDGNRSVVLLAHQPKTAKKALDEYSFVDLVLSGHTHGGQMHPMSFIIRIMNPFLSGLYDYKQGKVLVSQGASVSGIPFRHFTRSEVNVIHLFRKED